MGNKNFQGNVIHRLSDYKCVWRDYDSSSCTGCGACAVACPVNCIKMVYDAEGFNYPVVDQQKCVECGMCTKVCHFRQKIAHSENSTYYAGFLKNTTQLKTVSSGGASWAIISKFINDGGVCYGAAQIHVGEIKHLRAETLDEASFFKRSKYLQSDITEIFSKIKKDLEDGRKVLVTGTSCQIAAIRSYLFHEYENLYTVDIICHGVPSIKIFKKYIAELEDQYKSKVTDLNCRNKDFGWKNNHYEITFQNGRKIKEPSTTNPFHESYLEGLINRPSCASCRYASLHRPSDVTLADFWRYNGKLDSSSDTGISLVICHTEKGRELLKSISDSFLYEAVSEESAVDSCRHLTKSPIVHPNRIKFFSMIDNSSFDYARKLCLKRSVLQKSITLLRRALNKGRRIICKKK